MQDDKQDQPGTLKWAIPVSVGAHLLAVALLGIRPAASVVQLRGRAGGECGARAAGRASRRSQAVAADPRTRSRAGAARCGGTGRAGGAGTRPGNRKGALACPTCSLCFGTATRIQVPAIRLRATAKRLSKRLRKSGRRHSHQTRFLSQCVGH